ncbi:MAG: hypothetical protein H7250_09390 [Flavobacterium sp.]|nr:hypothetical protein [Flavobacterium sp.]
MNFNVEENTRKNLFLIPPQFSQNVTRIGGGAGCANSHKDPEFDIIRILKTVV